MNSYAKKKCLKIHFLASQEEINWAMCQISSNFGITFVNELISLIVNYCRDNVDISRLEEDMNMRSNHWPLASKGIIDDECFSIMQSMDTCTTLNHLGLFCNNIGNEGAKIIGEALESNSTLTRLNLKGNYIGDNGATSLAKTLKVNSVLIHLTLAENKIVSHGGCALVKALHHNTIIKTLELYKNYFEEDALKTITKDLGIRKVDICFKPEQEEKWGFEYTYNKSFNAGVVTTVDGQKQAHGLGIKVGDRIIAVNSEKINPINSSQLFHILSQKEKCTVTLRQRPITVLHRFSISGARNISHSMKKKLRDVLDKETSVQSRCTF